MLGTVLEAWGSFVYRRRWPVLGSAVLLLVATAIQGMRSHLLSR